MTSLSHSIRLTIAATLLSSAAVASDCEFENNLSLDLEGNISQLRLLASAGSLEVRGVEGSSRIQIDGRACASDEDLLAEMELVQRGSGNGITVETVIPENNGGWFKRSYARIDLVAEVPASLALDIVDGSGATRISHVGPLRIVDGSGEMFIQDVGGDLAVVDGSGELEIRRVAGNVELTDGSGAVSVIDVDGSVDVIEDGSGEMLIRGIGQDVLVRADGSGEIDISDVGGHATVERDGSGSIRARNVVGNFDVHRDGSGGVTHAEIGGNIDIPEDKRKRY